MLESKSNLARLLATENIMVEQRNVNTAYFNLKDRTLVMPTLKNEYTADLFDLFIGHEVGHALHTPADGWHDSITELGIRKSILNVCEDVRIEKLIRRKFPGLRPAFIQAYHKLLDMDFFGIKNDDINTYNFIDRVNLHTKCGVSMGVEFKNQEELDLLHECENTETWEEVVEVAKKIQEYLKREPKEEETSFGEPVIQSGEPGESSDVDINGESESFESEESQSGQQSDIDDSGENGEDLESKTDNTFREREKELFKKTSRETVYANIPKVNLDKIIVNYKDIYREIAKMSDKLQHPTEIGYKIDKKAFTSFKNTSAKTVSYLAREFEMRRNAQQLKRAAVSKTGELNMNKIYSYQFCDDVFKKITTVPNGKSHGLVMFLDWSGSMDGVMHDTIKQVLTLALFCKKVSIPFDVYAFTVCNNDIMPMKLLNFKVKDLAFAGSFHLMNILSSKMNPSEFSYAASALLSKFYVNSYAYPGFNLGATPLNETIVTAMELIPAFRKNYKLEIVNAIFLTDGEGHPLREVVTDNYGHRQSTYGDIVITDPVTKAQYKTFIDYSCNSSKPYLFMLKQRVDCNIIGFRIINTRELRSFLRYSDENPNTAVKDRLIGEFKKNKSLTLKDTGFDELYLLKDDSMDSDGSQLEVNKLNTRALVNSFKNYTKSRVENKVILNRFITLIS